MDKRTIYPQEGLQLRKVGKQYMIVKANENNVNMSDVYSLNRTAAAPCRKSNNQKACFFLMPPLADCCSIPEQIACI